MSPDTATALAAAGVSGLCVVVIGVGYQIRKWRRDRWVGIHRSSRRRPPVAEMPAAPPEWLDEGKHLTTELHIPPESPGEKTGPMDMWEATYRGGSRG